MDPNDTEEQQRNFHKDIHGLTRLVNLTSACLNQQHTRVVGSGCKVITQDADNFDDKLDGQTLPSTGPHLSATVNCWLVIACVRHTLKITKIFPTIPSYSGTVDLKYNIRYRFYRFTSSSITKPSDFTSLV